MLRHISTLVMVFCIGLLLGILVEARVFSPIRVAEALTAEQNDFAAASLDAGQSADASQTEAPADAPAVPDSVAAPPSDDSSPAPTANSPQLTVDQPTFDFGEVEQGDKITHVFVLRNTGQAPLSITRVQPSCGCTVAKLTAQEIGPGQVAQIETTLDLNGLSGPQNRVIMVQSNDPKTPVFRLAMVGKSNSRVVREPTVLMLGRVAPDAHVTGSVEVTTIDDLTLTVHDSRTSDDHISASVEEITPGKHYRLNVNLTGSQPGPYQGWVRLVTDHKGAYREIPIPVRAQVGDGGGLYLGDVMDISGPTLEGKDFDIKSYRGGPVVVVFWASWCGHCQREVPNLVTLEKKYRPNGLHVVGINVDRESDKAIAAREKWQVPWSDIHFPKNADGSADPLSKRYEVSGIPAVFLLDRDGRVVAKDARGAKLDEAIDRLVQPSRVAVRDN